MTTGTRAAAILLALATTAACNRDTAPSPIPTTIEFRVTGDIPAAVRIDNGIDGTTQVTSTLPYSHVITVTQQTPLFVSVSAQGFAFGFLHVAIFVNGNVYREASDQAFAPFVQVDGTWRPTIY